MKNLIKSEVKRARLIRKCKVEGHTLADRCHDPITGSVLVAKDIPVAGHTGHYRPCRKCGVFVGDGD